MTPEQLVLIAFGVPIALVAAGVIYLSHRRERKRRETLARMASERGYAYVPDTRALECAGDLRLFEEGHDHAAYNVMRGKSEGAPFILFDLVYRVGGGKSEYTVRRTMAAFRLQGTLSPFELRPEGMLDKLGSLLGMQDIDFPENPDFSDSYLLRAKDERRTREDFNRNVLAFFSGHHGWSARGGGSWVAFHETPRFSCDEDLRVPPERLWEFFDEARFGSTFFCP